MTPSICLVAPHGEGAVRSRLGLPTDLGFGGAEVQTALIGVGLATRGYAITFLCRARPQAEREERLGGVRLLRMPTGRRFPPGLRVLTDLGAALDAAGAAIVYQRCAQPLTGMLAWQCRRRGRRFVFAVANDRDVDGRARRALGPLRHALFRSGLRRADRIVVQSRTQMDLLPAALRARAVEIPSAFDLAGIEPRPEPPEPAILWIGNLLAKKRPDLLLALARRLPHVRFIAVAPDAGDTGLATRFRDEAATLPNVERHGRVPQGEMGRLFARARLLLNTSEAEGVPNTFLEAWARTVPVVSLGIDPDGVIERLGLGLVATPDSAGTVLEGFLRDGAARDEAGRRARAHVTRRHALLHVLDRYQELFAALA